MERTGEAVNLVTKLRDCAGVLSEQAKASCSTSDVMAGRAAGAVEDASVKRPADR